MAEESKDFSTVENNDEQTLENKDQANVQHGDDKHPFEEDFTEETSEVTQQKFDELEQQNRELNNKVEELKDKYLRLYADFDNFRKRMMKEKVELTKTAGENILKELLPVLDDFERAITQVQNAQSAESAKEGIELIHHKLQRNLEQSGLKPMKALGEDFNPDFHEAVTEVQVQDESKKGKVIDEVEKGYYLNDKIIRYAKVIVGR